MKEVYEAVSIRRTEYTEVFVVDDMADDPAHASHDYNVTARSMPEDDPERILGLISFQRGPIKENGVNGVQNEDLLAIVIDRLRNFQDGPYACRENAMALQKAEEALLWLDKRTADSKARNVEGTNKK